jgi:alpha-beta hydrolase superfamily lysophospholipase
MKKELFRFPSRDQRTQLHAVRWIPDGAVCGIVQICHGLFTCAERYERFAEALADRGFYVVGQDMLGFGKSVAEGGEYGFFTDEKGDECLLTDMRNLFLMTTEKYPDKPYFMFGQGMGSILVQQYITIFGDELNGVILSGTLRIPPKKLRSLKWHLRLLGRAKSMSRGDKKMREALFGEAMRGAPESRFAWMTKNEAMAKAPEDYLANQKELTLNVYNELLRAVDWNQNNQYLKRIAKGLPILIIGGREDRMTHNGEDLRALYVSYLQNRITDVLVKLYPGDRSDLLFEQDYETVTSDILTWLAARAKRGR